jgi:hypothetical protein
MLIPISLSLLIAFAPVWTSDVIVVVMLLPLMIVFVLRLAGIWGLFGGIGGGFLPTPPTLVLNDELAIKGWGVLFGVVNIPIDGTVVFDNFLG